MNTKFNKYMAEAAADPLRRRAAIANFTRQHTVLFWCALVVTASALVMRFTPAYNQKALTLLSLGAVLMWLVVFRIDSHRRTLLRLDQNDQAKDKPTPV